MDFIRESLIVLMSFIYDPNLQMVMAHSFSESTFIQLSATLTLLLTYICLGKYISTSINVFLVLPIYVQRYADDCLFTIVSRIWDKPRRYLNYNCKFVHIFFQDQHHWFFVFYFQSHLKSFWWLLSLKVVSSKT